MGTSLGNLNRVRNLKAKNNHSIFLGEFFSLFQIYSKLTFQHSSGAIFKTGKGDVTKEVDIYKMTKYSIIQI